MTSLKTRLLEGEPVFGTMARMVRNPAIIPLAKASGLDFIMFDLEHGAYTLETLGSLALAGRGYELPVLARVPELSRAWISGALDTGLAGVMVPMIETPEQARQLVEWSKYPPLGGRGFCSLGAHTGYTTPPSIEEFLDRTNEEILTIGQIETVDGVTHAEAIARTPGLDVVLVGPSDLSNSLGHPGKIDTPEEIEAITRVARAVEESGAVLGTHSVDSMLQRMVPMGLKFLMNGIDLSILASGMAEVNTRTRRLFTAASGPKAGGQGR